MTDHPTEPRLDVLIDRACRHLTPAEANALRDALAGTMRNATAAVEELHQRAADAEDRAERAEGEHGELRHLRDQWKWRARDNHRIARLQRERAERAEQQAAAVRAECETWKAKAEEIERDRDRIATEHTEFVLKAGEQIGRAQADTELLRRTVRAECDAIEREQYGQHDEDADGMREAARRIRAALDAAGQPDCPSCEAGIDHDAHCPTPETHNHGCACSPSGEEAGR